LEAKKEKISEEYAKAGQKNDVGLLMELQEKIDNVDLEILEMMTLWENSEKELEGIVEI
jgi:hypothetical protein